MTEGWWSLTWHRLLLMWCHIGDKLSQVVADSLCGKQAFGCQCQFIEGESLEKLVRASNAKLLEFPVLNKAMLANARADFAADAEMLAINVQDSFPTIREMSVFHRDMPCNAPGTSYLDYFNIAFMSLVRGLAVDIGDLKACLCEDDLVAKPRPAVTMNIDKGFLVEASIARAQLSKFASELEDVSGESIMSMFKSKMCMLTTIEEYMMVDQSLFVSMIGDSG